jgi:hypothetical protein
MWLDPIASTLHVFGEVRNTGDVWLRNVRITGTLRSVYGGAFDVVSVYSSATYLPPGGVVPFDMTENGTGTGDPYSDKAARVHSYTLTVEFQESSPAPLKLAILDAKQSKDSVDRLEVVGEVQNQADTPSMYTRVFGTFYGANGKVVYVASTQTNPSDIAPGMKTGFKLSVPSGERSGEITHYSLLAESEEYTSVPESPLPASLAVIVLLLTTLTMKRTKRNEPADGSA